MTNYITLSQDFLYAVRTGKELASYIDALKNVQENILIGQLTDDAHKKAFWLNIYNAYVQMSLKKDVAVYTKRLKFYSGKTIKISSYQISLDDIEHGILRRSKLKWSFGYLSNPFPSAFEKKFKIAKLDYRIHFALNCGAASCPPIAFYNPEIIDDQLLLATEAYLTSECDYNTHTNAIRIPEIFWWFRADFGGNKGIVKLLQDTAVIPAGIKPKIKFKKYDWTLQLDKFS